MSKSLLATSVEDPWNFGADPHPRIHTSDYWIWIWFQHNRIQIRIRLLSSVTLRMQKILLLAIFSYNLPAGTLSSVLKILFLLKFCVKLLFCKHYFSPFNSLMRKGKDPAGSISLTNESGSGRPKNIRIPNTASYRSIRVKSTKCHT